MQKTYLLCKNTSKWLNGNAPHHDANTFTHINDLLYKHAMDTTQKFLVLFTPKSGCFILHINMQDKSGYQNINRTYNLIKWQYYWKGMNKDICKYIANCMVYKREKANIQMYPLQITHIPDQQNSHRSHHRLQCLHIRKPTHSNYH